MVPLKYAQDSVLAYPSNCKSLSYVVWVWWTLLTEKLTMGMLLVLGLTSGAWPSWAAAGRPRQRMRSGASRLLLIVGPHRQLGTPGDPGPGNHEYIMWDPGPVSHVISNILGKLNNFY